ncbi:MAG: hypothetical protein LBS50_05265 [Prevotellaceae bacterium]|jgi:hypothetical protein|nr:hypothetical protein [Prevotellaceae bacterium]
MGVLKLSYYDYEPQELLFTKNNLLNFGLSENQIKKDSTLKLKIRRLNGGNIYECADYRRSRNAAKIAKMIQELKPKEKARGLELDVEAHKYYSAQDFSEEKIMMLVGWATVMNELGERKNNMKQFRARLGKKTPNTMFYGAVMEWYNTMSAEYGFSAITSIEGLRVRHDRYMNEGYESLINKGIGNARARKVDDDLLNLIISKYCESNKPYAAWVAEDITSWLNSEILLADKTTGEVIENKYKFNSLSARTVLNYLNNPASRAMIESARLSYHKYGAEIRPYTHRKTPIYSLSKISLDDRDLPRKMHNGNRVKAYYAYDVMSGAVVGAAYSQKKDEGLFIGCLRDMFRNLEKWGLGLPLEMEVENHLVRNFRDGLMKAGEVFPFVRWCAPTNSQEKHAENLNRVKKYSVEKRNQKDIGRWWSKVNTNVAEFGGERYYNEQTDRYELKQKTYDYDTLVADDLAMVEKYNSTRVEKLKQCANPNAPKIEREKFAQYLGESVKTSIRRNQYCRVQYSNYQLPNVSVLTKFAPNNYGVDAYYFEDENGEIPEVYLYQNGKFICVCKKIVEFSTARAEWTDADKEAMTEQMKYIKNFDKTIKEERKARVRKLVTEEISAPIEREEVEVEIVGADLNPPAQTASTEFYLSENWAAEGKNLL